MRLQKLFVAAALLLAACATEANYQRILQTWVGRSQDDLVVAWGPPDRSANLSDGGAVWEYVNRQEYTTGGVTTYTQQTVPAAGTVIAGGSAGSYSGTQTVLVPQTSPTHTHINECVTRFVISATGTIRSWTTEGNACVAADSGFALRPPPPSAPAAAVSTTSSTLSTSAAQLADAGGTETREYPSAHISISSAAPFIEKSETFDPYMPPYVQLSQVLDGGRYIVASFLPMDLPVIEPREYLTELAEKSPEGQGLVIQAAAYGTWRGLHSARSTGQYADGNQTLHMVRRVVWLEAHKGLLTLVAVAPSQNGAEDALGTLEEAIAVL